MLSSLARKSGGEKTIGGRIVAILEESVEFEESDELVGLVELGVFDTGGGVTESEYTEIGTLVDSVEDGMLMGRIVIGMVDNVEAGELMGLIGTMVDNVEAGALMGRTEIGMVSDSSEDDIDM
jgi:hypothetical protein